MYVFTYICVSECSLLHPSSPPLFHNTLNPHSHPTPIPYFHHAYYYLQVRPHLHSSSDTPFTHASPTAILIPTIWFYPTLLPLSPPPLNSSKYSLSTLSYYPHAYTYFSPQTTVSPTHLSILFPHPATLSSSSNTHSQLWSPIPHPIIPPTSRAVPLHTSNFLTPIPELSSISAPPTTTVSPYPLTCNPHTTTPTQGKSRKGMYSMHTYIYLGKKRKYNKFLWPMGISSPTKEGDSLCTLPLHLV